MMHGPVNIRFIYILLYTLLLWIIDVCVHVTTHIVNNVMLLNFNQEYVNIILATICILLYYIFLMFYVSNV